MTKNKQDNSLTDKQPWGIRSLDILGKKFSLSFETSSGKFQTSLGGYLTLALTLISLGTFVLIFSQYFNKDSPVVTTSSEFDSKITQFNLYNEDLSSPMGISLGPTRYLMAL